MANFSAADVKHLREQTGAGMMDCKNALEEADGDVAGAMDALRTKGAAKAAKRAEREAGAGLVVAAGNTLLELRSETDFVAKSDDFVSSAQQIVDAAEAQGATDIEAVTQVTVGDKTVAELVEELLITIGEKIELGRVARFDGQVVTYLHKRAVDLPPTVGVLVEYAGDADAARGAAMQVAAMRPTYLDRTEVPEDVVAKERELAEANAREEGKPEQAISKIIEGRVNAYYKDHVLRDQPSVTDSKQSVQQVLDEAGTTVQRFARFEVGS